jgi:hypothetical protein
MSFRKIGNSLLKQVTLEELTSNAPLPKAYLIPSKLLRLNVEVSGIMLAGRLSMDTYDVLVAISLFFLPCVGFALGLVILIDACGLIKPKTK